MNIPRGQRRARPRKNLIEIDSFSGGTMTVVDEARLDKRFAAQSTNLIQTQDGRWRTRWGFDYYGATMAGEAGFDGCGEYIKTNDTRELIAIGATTGKFFKSADDARTWTEITGVTFTPGNRVHFVQVGGELYCSNGVNDLVRYNGTTLTQYTTIAAPTGLAVARGAGLSAGSYTYYYQVTAVRTPGYTEGSTEASVTVNKTRDTWVAASNEKISLTWNAVVGSTSYDVFLSDQSGYEAFITRVTTNSYTDDGTAAINDYIDVPDDNTTTAPRFGPMELSGNRLLATKDPDNKYRVYGTGTGVNLGNFSPFYGGFWVDLEKGGRDKPEVVVHYRTGKGDPIATVLTSTPEGTGSIWQIELTSTTVGDFTFAVPVTYKIVGSIGTNAPLSVVKARDNIGFANKKGWHFLRNKEQLYNVLSTDRASQAIDPSWNSLNGSMVGNICASYYDGKIFISVPEGSENDTIIIYDMERNNWNYKWTRGVKRFFEYTDTAGDTHFLAIPTTGGRLWEISENFLGDFGAPFAQSYISPLLPVSKDSTDVYKTKEALIELGRPRGSVTFSISGLEAKRGFIALGSRTIADSISSTGWSYDGFSNFKFSDTAGIPTTFSQASIKKTLKIRKQVYALQFQASSEAANTDFTILKMQMEGRLLARRSPSAWRN